MNILSATRRQVPLGLIPRDMRVNGGALYVRTDSGGSDRRNGRGNRCPG